MRRITRQHLLVALIAAVALAAGSLASFTVLNLDTADRSGSRSPAAKKLVFQPDRTTLRSCDPSRPACLEQAYGNISYRRGPTAALSALQQAVRQGTMPSCHPAAHAIGRAALKRFKGDVGGAFAAGDSTCNSGYYHGILQDELAGADASAVDKLVSRVCDGASMQISAFLLNQCLHGLGHGAMILRSYDLPRALGICDALEVGGERQGCYGGVFMENFSSTYPNVGKWAPADDPARACRTVGRTYREECYYQMGAKLIELKRTWAEFAQLCGTVDDGFASSCYRSLGAFAVLSTGVSSGAGSSTAGTPARISGVCRLAPADEASCALGASRSFATFDPGGKTAATFCHAATAPARPLCFSGIGDVMGSRSLTISERRRLCTTLTSRYVANCIGKRPT